MANTIVKYDRNALRGADLKAGDLFSFSPGQDGATVCIYDHDGGYTDLATGFRYRPIAANVRVFLVPRVHILRKPVTVTDEGGDE